MRPSFASKKPLIHGFIGGFRECSKEYSINQPIELDREHGRRMALRLV
jgi:hypothetical protein